MRKAWDSRTTEYRIIAVDGGFQPEMRYQCRNGKFWVSLNLEGYWANPDDFSNDDFREQHDIPSRSVMTETEAHRSIWLAMKINKS